MSIDNLIIDVRNNREYEEQHIEGSINVPEYEIDENFKNIVKNNNATLTVATIKNNIITCASISINNLSSPKVFLSGNYFDNTNSSTCVVFKDNSSGNVYTCNNVNSGTLVAANGMTETQK